VCNGRLVRSRTVLKKQDSFLKLAWTLGDKLLLQFVGKWNSTFLWWLHPFPGSLQVKFHIFFTYYFSILFIYCCVVIDLIVSVIVYLPCEVLYWFCFCKLILFVVVISIIYFLFPDFRGVNDLL
jgi:hypothetical protein